MLPGGAGVAKFGFGVETLPPSIARRLETGGVFVNYVSQLSAAAEAGLRPEDIILRVTTTAIDDAEEFDWVVRDRAVDRLRLDVFRPSTGQRGYITVDVGERLRQAD
jgi:S1-C subfamily serine protease